MIDNNDKIKGILQSNSLDELPLKYLPPVSDTPDNYYFISYSHLDYKYVYKDIYALQSQGVNVWYDRAMPAGISWKETAEKYIRPSRCAGVVFYISENSLLSRAIHEEIAFAKKCGKSCLTINIPLSDNGKSVSAKEMLDEMISQGKDISTEKYDFICDTFNADVLYLPYSAEADVKAEKITVLKKPSIFKFKDNGFGGVCVAAVRDAEVRIIKESDFLCTTETGEVIMATSIGECAFANCFNLEEVTLPDELTVICEYAFYGCVSLKTINLQNITFINDYAFAGCNSLEYVGLTADSPLTNIGDWAFLECYSLADFVIPNQVDTIGKCAFYDSGLTSITIPEKVGKIEVNTFLDCEDLTDVIISDGVYYVGESAFVGCGIQNLYIGANVGEIYHDAFVGCASTIKKIKVSPKNQQFYSVGGCLVSRADGKIILGNQDVFVPNVAEIKTIGEYAFADCDEADTLIIPSQIETIEEGAFSGCSNLQSVYISKNVKEIGSEAFKDCDKLQQVNVSDLSAWCNMEFGAYANPLRYARNLCVLGEPAVDLIIFSKVKTIKSEAFADCDSLKTVDLQNVKVVEGFAFDRCKNLKRIIVHDSITSFTRIQDCDNLQYAKYDNGLYLGDEQNPYIVLAEVADRNLTSCKIHPKTKIVAGSAFLGCKKLTTVEIPQGVQAIGAFAFWHCDKFNEITIPDSVHTIEASAFEGCTSLTIIHLSKNVKYLGDRAFYDSVYTIHYNGTAQQWFDIEKSADWHNQHQNIQTIICADGVLTRNR